MDKDEVQPQQSSKAMDEDEDEDEDQQQQQVVDGDPYGFLVEQCIIPSAEENHLRSMPLFSPPPPPIPTQQQQQQPSPPPVVKHEQTDGIDRSIIQQQQPALEMEKEKEATQNMEVNEESQSLTKEQPTISIEKEGFSQQTRDEPVAADDDETPSPLVTGEEEELQKTIEEEEEEEEEETSPQKASLGKSPLEQNEGLVQPQSPPTKTQTEQTHFVPQPAAADDDVEVAPSSSSSNPQNPKGGGGGGDTTTTIDLLDVLRSKGFHVPRPRWWRPEGYDKP